MSASAVRAIAATYREAHRMVRGTLDGLEPEALAWAPAEGANSIAVLVTHLVGSEVQAVRMALAQSTDRDRDAEFKARADVASLRAALDGADRLLDDFERAGAAVDLEALRSRGTGAPPLPVIDSLVMNAGHAREHAGHVELTAQLYRSRRR